MTRLCKRPGRNAGQVPSVRAAVVSREDPQGIPRSALQWAFTDLARALLLSCACARQIQLVFSRCTLG